MQYEEQRNREGERRKKVEANFQLHRYHSMMSRIGITVAHEMEHVFTGYLLMDPRAHTPPNVDYGGFGRRAVGESGRFMEGGVFGGFLDMKLEVATNMEVMAVRTYAQTFILSSDQVNAIIRRGKSRRTFTGLASLFILYLRKSLRIVIFKTNCLADYVIEWNILPTYDPDGDSYEGPPRVTPPKKVDLEKWRDEFRYQYIITGEDLEPELSVEMNLNLRQGLYGARRYRLRCESLRKKSKDPGAVVEVVYNLQALTAIN